MRLVTYRPKAGDAPWRVGVADGASVAPAGRYDRRFENSASVRTLLEAGQGAIDGILAAAQGDVGDRAAAQPLDAVELGPPIPDPDKIICLGLNYADHAAEGSVRVPAAPMLFAKFRTCLIGPYADVPLPAVSSMIDYEGELAAVIGRRCKSVSEADALAYVGGYSIMNDLSARDLQHQTTQVMAGKALDGFAPMGPGVVAAREIPDPQALQLTTRVNGEVRQSSSTGAMIFSVAATIAFISSLITLEPGDIIATGTPAGVGWRRKPPLYLQSGDVVEIEIERVGRIANRMVR